MYGTSWRTLILCWVLFQLPQFVTAYKPAARIFPELFAVPNSCYHNGAQYSCTFVLFCWWGGAQFLSKCGNSWMFTCCVPKGIPLKAAPAPARNDVHIVNPSQCGIQKMSVSKRIIGGETASFAEFPWLNHVGRIQIHINKDHYNYWRKAHIRISGQQCGGVLLNSFYVATAAHCVRSARLGQISVILGEHDLQDTGRYFEPLPMEVYGVTEKRIHPSFLYMLTQPDRYDVALLRLNRRVIFRDNVLPICLPQLGGSADAVGKMAVVAGWGKTDPTIDSRTGTYILQKVHVPLISDKECTLWHQQKKITLMLYPEMMCAGYREGKKDASDHFVNVGNEKRHLTADYYKGDSGGPLMALDRGRWTLIGITSAGFGCALDRQPGIYHKITSTLNWIAGSLA